MTLDRLDRLNVGHGKEVSCAHATTIVHRVGEKITTATSIPVEGASVVCFPIAPEHVTGLLACEQLDCSLAPMLDAILHPDQHVLYTEPYDEEMADSEEEEEERLTYRSGGGGGSAPLRPLRVLPNPDGGFSAVLPVAPFLSRTTTPHQRAELAKPMLECIVEGLQKAGIPAGRVFGDEYVAGDESTVFGFLALLFDAMTPEADIIIGVMAEGKTGGRFTFLHVADVVEGLTIPMLGLTHGDLQPVQELDEAHYLVTFDPRIRIVLPADEPLEEGEEKADATSLHPSSPRAYCKDYFSTTGVLLDVTAPPLHRGPRGEHTRGNDLWASAQRAFQIGLCSKLYTTIRGFLVHSLRVDEVGGDANALRVLNLQGRLIPRCTIQAEVRLL